MNKKEEIVSNNIRKPVKPMGLPYETILHFG